MTRAPHPLLAPFVQKLWASRAGGAKGGEPAFERALPTGMMHLVVRTSPDPVVVADDPSGTNRRILGHALVGGARSRSHLRDVSLPSTSVGVMLLPGAARVLFGTTAGALAEVHTSLGDLWGGSVCLLEERLLGASSATAQLDLLEAELLSRLSRKRVVHPDVDLALARLHQGAKVGAIVSETGGSHRQLLNRFRETVGLSPKTFSRVIRVQRAIGMLRGERRAPLAEIAVATGFADQAHFCREFLHVTGVTPLAYRRIDPIQMNHVPWGERR